MRTLILVGLLAAACSNPQPPAGSSKPGVGECGSVPLADFQALIKDPIAKLEGNPVGACNVYVAPHTFLFAATIETGPDWDRLFDPHAGPAVPGVGDVAYYTPSSDHGPNLHSKKGATYCIIESPETAHTTLTGTSPANLAAYAQLMAKLCSDMFAAH